MADEETPQPQWEGPYDEEGKPHGKGKLTYVPPPAGEDDEEEKQPDTYEGDMEHGVRQGSGTYKWSNGTLYVGSYVAGKKHGRGKLTFPDKSVYEGEFLEDVMEGQATYTCANGDMYQGAYKANKKHGKGMYHYKAAGCQLVGEWEEGSFKNGRWIYQDGSMFSGTFKDTATPAEGAYFMARSKLTQAGSFAADGLWLPSSEPVVGKEFVYSV